MTAAKSMSCSIVLQAHYDHDNPPPKTVQGYKFNVFYPDLIDRTRTPQFSLEPAANREFAFIRFSAGPPYEDVAFQIVNREWDKGRKSGFKCIFERGVLSLFLCVAAPPTRALRACLARGCAASLTHRRRAALLACPPPSLPSPYAYVPLPPPPSQQLHAAAVQAVSG